MHASAVMSRGAPPEVHACGRRRRRWRRRLTQAWPTSLGLGCALFLLLLLAARLPGAAALATWEKLWDAPNPPVAPGNGTAATGPANRQSHGMALWGDALVVHGGVGAERTGLSDLWTFDLVSRAWAPVAQGGGQLYYRAAQSLFARAEGPGGAQPGLYMWGGRDMPNGDTNAGSTAGTNVLLKFTPTTPGALQDGGAWETVPTTGSGPEGALPDGRCDHTGLLYVDPTTGKERFLVYGGRVIEANDNSIARLVFGDVWSLDMDTSEWTLLSPGTDKGGPPPRFLHASAILDGGKTLAIFGGLTFYGSSLFALDDVWLLDLATGAWTERKMDTPLLRSALPMVQSTVAAPNATAPGDQGTGAAAAPWQPQVPALFAFAGYVIYTNAGLAVVYNDLLVWDPQRSYWEKLVNDRNKPAPQPRFDHRGVLWKGTTLVFYGGSYQSVNDVGDVWMLDTAAIEPGQLAKAPPEGINALFYGRLLFIFASLLTMCFFSLCFSLRMRMNIMQRARLNAEQQAQQAGDAAGREERARQTEEALRLLPVITYERLAPQGGNGGEGGGGGGGAAAAAAGTDDGGESGTGGGGGAGTAAAAAAVDDDRDDTCAICLSTYEPRDVLRCLPCGHRFHQQCCDQWLRTSLTCPLCKTCASPRLPLRQASASAASSTTAGADDASLLPPGTPTSSGSSSGASPGDGAAATAGQQQRRRLGGGGRGRMVTGLLSSLNPFRGGSSGSGSSAGNAGGGGGGAVASDSSTTEVAFFPAAAASSAQPPAAASGAPASTAGLGPAGPSVAVAVPGPSSGGGGGLDTPYTEMRDIELHQPVAASSSSSSSSSSPSLSSSPPLPPSSQRGAAGEAAAVRDMEEGRVVAAPGSAPAAPVPASRDSSGGGGAGAPAGGGGDGTVSLV